jgi:hypothetical protein
MTVSDSARWSGAGQVNPVAPVEVGEPVHGEQTGDRPAGPPSCIDVNHGFPLECW